MSVLRPGFRPSELFSEGQVRAVDLAQAAGYYRDGMDFFGVGPLELLMLLVVGLIVLGPERLPETAIKVGRFIREFRATYSRLAAEVMRELEAAERETPTSPAEAEYRPAWSSNPSSPVPTAGTEGEGTPRAELPAVQAPSAQAADSPLADTAPLGAPSTPPAEDGARRAEPENPSVQ
ncbi:MAG: hypothetical protein C4316_10220 [Chloroflexota bacterium]